MDENTLFEVCCTTCEARFAVTDSELIGQIVACPKCGGMILIEQPQSSETVPVPGVLKPPAKEEPVSETPSSAVPPVADETSIAPESFPLETSEMAPPVLQEVTAPDGEKTFALDEAPPSLSSVLETLPPVLDSVPGVIDTVDSVSSDSIESGSILANKTALLLTGTAITLFLIVVLFLWCGRSGQTTIPSSDVPSETNQEPPLDSEANTPVSPPTEPVNQEETPIAPPAPATGLPGQKEAKSPTEPEPKPADTPDTANPEKTSSEPPKTPETPASAPSDVPKEMTPAPQPDEINTPEKSTSSPIPAPQSNAPKEDEDEMIVEGEEFAASTRTSDGNFQKSLPVLKSKTSAVQVDQALKLRIPEINLSHDTPASAFDLVSELTGVPVSFDLSRFELMRPAMRVPLELKMQNTTADNVLTKIAELLQLAIVRQPDRVLVTASQKTDLFPAPLDLSDLVQKGSAASGLERGKRLLSPAIQAAEINQMIEELIAPVSWKTNGGQATLEWKEATLTVRQKVEYAKQVERLMEQIRQIRKLPLKKEIPIDQLIPEIEADKILSKKMNLNFIDPVSLITALQIIAKNQNLQIIFDDDEASKKGINRQSRVQPRVNDVTVSQVLTTLLTPMKLDWVVLASDQIMVTSQEAAAAYETTEIHLFAIPGQNTMKEKEIADLIERVEAGVAAGSWHTTDSPAVTGKGIVWCDPTSSCLIIRHSQPVQRLLRGWLERHLTQSPQDKQVKKTPEKQ